VEVPANERLLLGASPALYLTLGGNGIGYVGEFLMKN
jgi:hypothetical protein